MPDFSNLRKAEAWFSRQRPKVTSTLAARAALRMLPLLGMEVTWWPDVSESDPQHLSFLRLVGEFTERAMPVFRAAALAALGASELQGDRRFNSAAVDAAAAAFDVAEKMYEGAADAAYVTQIALECISSLESENLAYAILDYSGTDLSALTSDAEFIEQASDPEERERRALALMRRPLWLAGVPDSVRKMWAGLKWALPRGENWWVWTEWYEAHLDGAPEIPRLEIILLSVEDHTKGIWDENSATINAAIATLMEAKGDVDEISTTSASGVPFFGPMPIIGVLSPVEFVTSFEERIRAVPSADVQPILKTPADRQDHRPRLDLCRMNAQSLLDLINGRTVNVRDGYTRALGAYLRYLPKNTKKRNLLFADQEARILRGMFAADVGILPVEFASRLRSFLQAHQALRVFYPGITRFYDDVRFGRTNEARPMDSADSILAIVAGKPELFDETVGRALSDIATPVPISLPDAFSTPVSTDPQPPPDPIGNIPTEKAQAYARAGTINRLWTFFQKGIVIQKNTEAWMKTGAEMAPHVARIVDWLAKFIGAGSPTP